MKHITLILFFTLVSFVWLFAQTPTLPASALCSENGSNIALKNSNGLVHIYERPTSGADWTLRQTLDFANLGFTSRNIFTPADPQTSRGFTDYSERYSGFGTAFASNDDYLAVSYQRYASFVVDVPDFNIITNWDTIEDHTAIYERIGSNWVYQRSIKGGNALEIVGGKLFVIGSMYDSYDESFSVSEVNEFNYFVLDLAAGTTQTLGFSNYTFSGAWGSNFGVVPRPKMHVSPDGKVVAISLLGGDPAGYSITGIGSSTSYWSALESIHIFRKNAQGDFLPEYDLLDGRDFVAYTLGEIANLESDRLITSTGIVFEEDITNSGASSGIWEVPTTPSPNYPVLSLDDSKAFLAQLSWTNNTDPDYFELYRTTIGGPQDELIATLCKGETQYVDTLLGFGQTAIYVLEAVYNSNSNVVPSNGVSYSMPATIAPLQLNFSCYNPATDSITWEVFNPNTQDHPFIFAQWWSTQRDTLYAEGGSSVSFKTKNNPQMSATWGDDNITGIWWINQNLTPGQPYDLVNSIPLGTTCNTARKGKTKTADSALGIFAGSLAKYMKVNTEDAAKLPAEIGLKIGPNPAGNVLHINGLEAEGTATIEVFNQMGQKVIQTEMEARPEMTLNLEKLGKGTYFLKIHSSMGSFGTKVLKK